MTSTPAHGVGRVVGASARPLRALSATPALIILLAAALGLRLLIAYVLFPGSGFASDLGAYVAWAQTMAHYGPGGFYANVGFADYPPGYMYVLWPIGMLFDVRIPAIAMAYEDIVKIPAILMDLALGYVLYRLVKGWAWPGRRAEALGLAAAALYLFNPVTWYDSALWGQTDAAGSLLLLLGVAALIRGNSEGASALAVLAALIKPQFGVVLIPVVGLVLLKRHLFRPGSGPRHRPWGPSAVADSLEAHEGAERLVTSFVIAWGVFFALALPFGMGPVEYLSLMVSTANGYPYLTVNAYNPWALIGSGTNPSLASAGTWAPDSVRLLGAIPAVLLGSVLLLGGSILGWARGLWRDDRRSILLLVAFLCGAFFILPTRVHERYLFPIFAVLPILAAGSRRWTWVLLALAVGSFMNLHAILTIPLYATDNIKDLAGGPLLRTYPFVLLSVVLQAAGFAFVAWKLRRSAADEPDPLAEAAAEAPVPVRAPTPATAGGDAPLPGSAGAAADRSEQPWADERGWVRGPSTLQWLAARISLPPLRRDRSAELAAERVGRIDRLDLLVVLLILVGSFALRAFNLAQPYDMYFDEVYHAQTATEFLQDWRYGIPHSIYEYTHPHLAKYAMALGIEAFGDNQVTGQSNLASSVDDAAVESRWSPDNARAQRNGDRLYVATGSEIRVFDLADRSAITTIDVPAVVLTLDETAHRLYAADRSGALSTIDTTALDDLRRDPAADRAQALPLGDGSSPIGAITGMTIADGILVAFDDDGRVAAWDDAGKQIGDATVGGASVVVRLPSVDRLMADPASVTDARTEAQKLAKDLGDEASRIEPLLAGTGKPVPVAAYLSKTQRTAIQGHIDDGTLPGVTIESGPMVAVGGRTGVTVLDAASLVRLDSVSLTHPVTGMALVERGLDVPTLYASGDRQMQTIPIRDDGPSSSSGFAMPGQVGQVLWNESSNLVHVVGTAPDGTTSTIYVIEPHGKAVFADAKLPFAPAVSVIDTQPDRPSDDRLDILAFALDGRMAQVDVGANAFAWRLPGVIMASLTAACLYLLARVLFRRRSVAAFTAVLVVAGGMYFANGRIAMNDAYVTGFLVAAVTLFAPIYLGIWRRPWQVAAALLGIGLLLGLALASKWVAAYAIGGLGVLVLLRSALGRMVALAAMIAMTAVLGALAIRPPDVEAPHQNWLFLGLMVVLTAALAAAMVRRPVRFTLGELRLAVIGPALVGLLFVLIGSLFASRLPAALVGGTRLTLIGAGLLVLGAAAYGVAWAAGRMGAGPLAVARTADPDRPRVSVAPDGWLQPGRFGGVPWLFALGCLTVVPVIVYIASYAPWVALGNQWPWGGPPGHTGQDLWQLTLSMYDYHNNLRATHAASSPWWAWPLDLKPVWFYQRGFANETTGVIYDSGNLVEFWLAIPAMLFTTWAAWRRRSLALTFVVLLFAAMWLPWARIDRATFQYHVYSSLPFVLLGLAYFLAELWHGPPRTLWLVARVAGAVAILGAPLLWLFRQPLCALAGTAAVNPNGIACGNITRSTGVSEAAFMSAVVVIIGFGVAAWQIWLATRSGGATRRLALPGGRTVDVSPMILLLGTLAVTLGAVAISVRVFSPKIAFTLTVHPEEIAIGGLLLLAAPAWLALRARDSRRFALGVAVVAVLWFVAWYPNLSGLPLPNAIANIYQGLLPTWNYDFQFAVNLDPPATAPYGITALVIAAANLILVGGVMLVARSWHSRPAEEPAGTAVAETA